MNPIGNSASQPSSLKFQGLLTKKKDPDDPYSESEARLALKLTERGLRFAEFQMRRGINKIGERRAQDFIETGTEFLKEIDPKSPKFMLAIGQMCSMMARSIETEVNLESGRLEEIAESDEACIFIMNHDDQRNDPAMMATFAAEMYKEYMKAGKIETAPRPKIILNEDILRAQSDELRNIYTTMGAVGVDADIADTDKAGRKNARTLLPVIRGFNNDENHVFIFPEGRFSAFKKGIMSGFTKMNERTKFQPGVGDIIYAAAKKKKRVKVVPLGLAAREKFRPGFKKPKKWKTPLGSIHIGEPVYFTLEDGKIHTTTGNITRENAFDGLRKFFWHETSNEGPNVSRRGFLKGEFLKPEALPEPEYLEKDGETYKELTMGGESISGRGLNARVISGILYANLKLCKDAAKKALPKNAELPQPEVVKETKEEKKARKEAAKHRKEARKAKNKETKKAAKEAKKADKKKPETTT